MPVTSPSLPVVVEVDRSMWDKLAPLAPAVVESVAKALSRMMNDLGIPGAPEVEVRSASSDGTWLQLRVAGHLCRYPDVLLKYVRAYVTGSLPDTEENGDRVEAWFSDSFDQLRDEAVSALTLACECILERQPAVLLQDAQGEAYLSKLRDLQDGSPLSIDRPLTTEALRAALSNRSSVADVGLVRQTLAAISSSDSETPESLIRATRSRVVEVRAGSDVFASLTQAGREQELVLFLREGLYEELGFLFPDVRLVLEPQLRPSAFRLRINSLDTVPFVSFGPGKILVNDTAERLRIINIEATPTLNVVTNQPAALVDAQKKETLEATGLTTWDEWGYVILVLADGLRRNAAVFIDSEFARMQLRKLARVFPKLVEKALRHIPLETMTSVLKRLMREQISIRDFRLVVERLLDVRYASHRVCRYVVLDDRLNLGEHPTLPLASDPDWTTEFVRQGMKGQIGNKYSRGTGTVVVYLLDKEIETVLGSAGPDGNIKEEDATAVLRAIRDEIKHLPATAQVPCLVTAGQVRPKIRALLAAEFPTMAAIAFAELPRDINVQPVARIAM